MKKYHFIALLMLTMATATANAQLLKGIWQADPATQELLGSDMDCYLQFGENTLDVVLKYNLHSTEGVMRVSVTVPGTCRQSINSQANLLNTVSPGGIFGSDDEHLLVVDASFDKEKAYYDVEECSFFDQEKQAFAHKDEWSKQTFLKMMKAGVDDLMKSYIDRSYEVATKFSQCSMISGTSDRLLLSLGGVSYGFDSVSTLAEDIGDIRLNGFWVETGIIKTLLNDNSEGVEEDLLLRFHDNSIDLIRKIIETSDEMGKLVHATFIPGSYTISGDVYSPVFDRSKMKFELIDIITDNPKYLEVKDAIIARVNESYSSDLKDPASNLQGELDKVFELTELFGDFKVESVSADDLTIQTELSFTFKRVK